MFDNKKILVLIPARGASKGIARKNIKPIAGKPLIAWTIESAKESKYADQILVSTEDSEIAEISKKAGAEVLKRPENLAEDHVPLLPVMQHALENSDADVLVWLQCTSPVRAKGLIDKCIERFFETKASALATGFICKLYEWGKYNQQRQDLKGWFHDDGNVYVIKADVVKSGNLWGEKMEQMEISREQNFEIDDEFDFWLNEQILKDNPKK